MSQTIVNFVVAQGDDIRRQEVHQFDRRKAAVFGIDDRASEHIPGDRKEGVFFFLPDGFDVAGEQGNTADQLPIAFFRKKITMHIIGM